jgi:hypothetical protein
VALPVVTIDGPEACCDVDDAAMICAVLEFSYAGTDTSPKLLAKNGFYTANLGDCAQTIAARGVLERLGLTAADVPGIDRDTLPDYDGPPAALLLNGVFYDRNFPVSDRITPVFIGFCTKSAALVQAHRDWFLRHGPVGCRDKATAALLAAEGIPAFVTGCVTLTLQRRPAHKRGKRFLVVYGEGKGALPPQVLRHIPPDLLDVAEFIHHRLPVNQLPLLPESRGWILRYEEHLLARYREEALLVLTPLLHVATPCLAMGVPVVLCRRNHDTRFDFVDGLLPVHTPDTAATIDWRPALVDVDPMAGAMEQALRDRLVALGVLA